MALARAHPKLRLFPLPDLPPRIFPYTKLVLASLPPFLKRGLENEHEQLGEGEAYEAAAWEGEHPCEHHVLGD